jgi:hypothetical protein
MLTILAFSVPSDALVDCHRLELRSFLCRRDDATAAHLAQEDAVRLEREILEL